MLADYSWSLKSWKGGLLATQYFMVSAQGKAARIQTRRMGRYTLCQNIIIDGYIPVYKQDKGANYLYRDGVGNWCVGYVVGDDLCGLYQKSNKSPSPQKTIPWQYSNDGWHDDETLKVYPCYY